MKKPIAATAASALALSACAAPATPPETPRPPQMGGLCKQGAADSFIGQKATTEIGEQIVAASGASVFQWVPPDTAVTMDYSEQRVRVSYNEAMVITAIRCG